MCRAQQTWTLLAQTKFTIFFIYDFLFSSLIKIGYQSGMAFFIPLPVRKRDTCSPQKSKKKVVLFWKVAGTRESQNG